jgi:arylsulfatase A-like enzyme
VVIALVLTTTACDAFGGNRPEPTPRPNIVVILTDDQPAEGTLEVMPETTDWFQEDGVRFTNAVATTPLCCPSRASIMTGLHTHHHGVTVDMNGDADRLDQSLTVQRHLRRAGYRTGYFGKYLNGWPLRVDPPHFDRWAIFDNSSPHGYFGGRWNVGGERKKIDEYSTDYLARRGTSFIESSSRSDKPWLLYIATAAPHPPYDAAPEYESASVPPAPVRFEQDTSDKPAVWRQRAVSRKAARVVRVKQLRTLMSVDDLVADVRRQLIESRVKRNTLVFFMSDNGYLWGQHRLNGKMAPYTESIQIPLLVSWPGTIARRGMDDRLAANLDVPATILDAARIGDPPPVDGRSLLEEWDRKELLVRFWETYARPSWAAIKAPDFQYIEYYESGTTDQIREREYYDLSTDAGQELNLLGDDDPANDPDVDRLSKRLSRLKGCQIGTCP